MLWNGCRVDCADVLSKVPVRETVVFSEVCRGKDSVVL